ncbi:Sbal_3080 family lipoprotein [Vibrio sp. WXL103]|uniref:Sbal_3080 family lipoprotein n=1 Tax=Vibrio sp. WXL103 TaxID=3450710 RepID=UPI003EC65AC3
MYKKVIAASVALLLTGCAAPKYQGSAIDHENPNNQVTIIKDEATRDIFLTTMLDWCDANQYTCKVSHEGTEQDEDELTLDYIAKWSWDIATFIGEARISAFHEGERVGNVTFSAPNNANLNKFGDDEARISAMMDVLFGLSSSEQATQLIEDGDL